jgi:hypothetical protein
MELGQAWPNSAHTGPKRGQKFLDGAALHCEDDRMRSGTSGMRASNDYFDGSEDERECGKGRKMKPTGSGTCR